MRIRSLLLSVKTMLDYMLKVALFCLSIIVLLALNRFFGGTVSAKFQFFANVALLLITAFSILVLLIRQLKASRAEDGRASAASKAELLEDIEKKIIKKIRKSL